MLVEFEAVRHKFPDHEGVEHMIAVARDEYNMVLWECDPDHKGVLYEHSGTYNFSFEETYPDLSEYGLEYLSYGVVDTVEQWLKIFSNLVSASDRHFFVSFHEIVKSEQHPTGGWRWHKNGAYLGNKKPQYEYIYDEDDSIQSVFCYHVIEVTQYVKDT